MSARKLPDPIDIIDLTLDDQEVSLLAKTKKNKKTNKRKRKVSSEGKKKLQNHKSTTLSTVSELNVADESKKKQRIQRYFENIPAVLLSLLLSFLSSEDVIYLAYNPVCRFWVTTYCGSFWKEEFESTKKRVFCTNALNSGSWGTLQWILAKISQRTRGINLWETQRFLRVLAQRVAAEGNTEILKWISNYVAMRSYLCSAFFEASVPWSPFTPAVAENAAEKGHLETLVWLRTNKQHVCPWDASVCAAAAKGGYLELLKWAKNKRCAWDSETCTNAAKYNHFELLKWARSNKWAKNNKKSKARCPWDKDTCTAAAQGGHLHILMWLRSRTPPCPWGTNTCAAAAENNHLHVLKWLRAEHYGRKCCSWDEQACTRAAKNGHLETLQWLRQEKCPWKEDACLYALREGHVEVVQWCLQNGCPCDFQKIWKLAAEIGSIEIFEWLKIQEFTEVPNLFSSTLLMNIAAQYNQIHVLKWLRNLNPPAPWNETTCAELAKFGSVENVEWIRSKGCPWNERTTRFGALHGHFKLFLWAYENGCPISNRLCCDLIKSMNANDEYIEETFKILSWLLNNERMCQRCPVILHETRKAVYQTSKYTASLLSV